MSVGSVSIRTRMVNNETHVDLRVSHPMESGRRKDSMGALIPSWYLNHLEIFHNDELVSTMKVGPLVSRNPAISLVLNGGAEDDIIKVVWVDNRGRGGESAVKLS